MRFDFFIARRISYRSPRSFSKVIIRIASGAIMLSLAIMLISDSIYTGFQSEIKDKITGFAASILVSKTNSDFTFENEPVPYDESFVKKIKAMPNVKHLQVFATKPGIVKFKNDNEGAVLKGVGKDFDWSFIKERLVEGRSIQMPDSEASTEVVIPKALADKLDIKLNDKIVMGFVQNPPRVRKFSVVGIFETGVEEIDRVFILTDIRQIQKLNNWPDEKNLYGGYEIFVKDPELTEQTSEEIADLGNLQVQSRTIQDRYPQMYDWLKLISANTYIILLLMLIVAIINMSTALIVMILERTQMIGIFKSMGADNLLIQRIFLINASKVILTGIVLGNLLGLGFLFFQEHTHSIKLVQENYYLAYVPVYFNWIHILVINIGAFVICTLAMLLPALFILNVKPSTALRFE